MDNNFLSHIIRDLFPNRAFTVIYNWDESLRKELLTPQHSVGAFQLHTERNNVEDTFERRFWEAGINNPFIQYGDVDLFISINYDPVVYPNKYMDIALQIMYLLKPSGKALIINPGSWARNIKNIMTIDGITTKEAKRYSMLKDQDVLVYENI